VTAQPVDPADLKKAHDDLIVAIEAAAVGGPAQTADKKKKRKVVHDMLEKLAHFVQIHCNNDMATLLSIGFTAVAQSTGPSPLAVPNITEVINGNTGSLVVKSKTIRL